MIYSKIHTLGIIIMVHYGHGKMQCFKHVLISISLPIITFKNRCCAMSVEQRRNETARALPQMESGVCYYYLRRSASAKS